MPIGDEAREARRRNIEAQRAAYNEAPKPCLQCGDPIKWEMRLKVDCCSRTCSGYRIKGLAFSRKQPRTCPGCGKRVTGAAECCSYKCQRACEWARRLAELIRLGEVPNGSPKTIRKYLTSTQPHACAICGTSEWMGKPAPLVADHINGNADDNRLVNLRLVCGNCDLQLPTSRGKNRGNGRAKRRQFYAARGYC